MESNIHFPATVSALPGRVRLWAYQRGICEAIDDPEVERVTVIKSARIGYPLRMLVFVPREAFAKFEAAGHGSIYTWLDRELGRGHYAIHAGGRHLGVDIWDRMALSYSPRIGQ